MIWFLMGLIGFTYLINWATLRYGFTNLKYNMEIGQRTAEIGEEVEIHSTIENKKPLSISFLKVREVFPEGFNILENIYTIFVMPYQRVKRTYKIIGNKRGLYNIRNVGLELGDFTGFKTEQENLEINKQLIILPKTVDLQDSIAPLGSLMGDISVKRWIIDDPLMTIGIREYTGSEPERYIHWPSSLKHGSLMVKSFDFTTDNSVIVVLNVESSKPYWKNIEKDIIEESISISRTIMEELEELKIPYGFATNAYNTSTTYSKGHFFHPGLGSRHLNNILEVLGSINYVVSSTFEQTLGNISRMQGNYTTIVIVTPKVLKPYIRPINSLSMAVTKTIVIEIEEQHLNDLNNNITKYRGL